MNKLTIWLRLAADMEHLSISPARHMKGKIYGFDIERQMKEYKAKNC